ncbi:hypothetical protein N7517_009016 [Penicillium concentricum]|uniref:Hypervirulence associated protein TUDOR domain-containing protein n=1 Tax=Penicillium concentricum TaxID=293559 RepID=A0A9W9RGL7_9EURO|nr:uncharacterized protein N7517_009016 [Penicillium concentricum]KAJ5359825.1 hypothetical protein N7517_009016 [Penicillium concentricum]
MVWFLTLVQAQMMASEYKKRGGGYNTTKTEGQTESQKHLENWTKEEWQTKEGSGTARQDDDSRKRYLPKKAWEQLSEKEKEETDEKKIEESQGGKQFVGNTAEAKEARQRVSSDVGGEDVGVEDQKVKGDTEKVRQNGEAAEKGTNNEEKTEGKKSGAGTKRSAKQDATPKKKQKDSARMESLRKRT